MCQPDCLRTLYYKWKRWPIWLTIAAIAITGTVATGAPQVPQFSPPQPIVELNSPGIDWTPWVSPDGLEIYFASDCDDDNTKYHIYHSTRPSLDAPFSTPVRVAEVNHPPRQHDPYLTDDGLKMYFVSPRPDGLADISIWEITRPTIDSPWDSATQRMIPSLNVVGIYKGSAAPQITNNGLMIYFHRSGPTGHDMFFATRASTDEDFGTPQPMAELNVDDYHDRFPYVTSDGLMIFFTSSRPGGRGMQDLYVAVRDSTDQPFGEPVNLWILNSDQHDVKPFFHEPTRTLYFCSNRINGDHDIYVSYVLVPPHLLFRNVTTTRGIAAWWPQSLAIGDFERDGDLDLFLSEAIATAHLYVNDGTGFFTDKAGPVGLAWPALGTISKSIFWDFNNDSFVDLYIAQLYDNIHMVNEGNGTFVNDAALAGLRGTAPCNSAVAFDYDRDGNLDLYLAQGDATNPQVHLLMRNRGDGTFEDKTTSAGLGETFAGGGALISDFDLDGDQDIYVIHNGTNRFYANNGDGTFTELTTAGLDLSGWAVGATAGDFDNDGDFDIVILNDERPIKLMRNNFRPTGNLTFSDVTVLAGLGSVLEGATDASFGDVDNDGDLDLYVCVRQFGDSWQDHLFRNNGDGTFEDCTTSAGLVDWDYRDARGCAIADLNGDGALDIVISCRDYAVMENISTDIGHWLSIELVGTQSNRDAIGALVMLKPFPTGPTQVRERRCAKPSGTQDSPWIHFGLGDYDGPVRVTVYWPSGATDTFSIYPVDRHVTLVEGAGTIPSLNARNWTRYD